MVKIARLYAYTIMMPRTKYMIETGYKSRIFVSGVSSGPPGREIQKISNNG